MAGSPDSLDLDNNDGSLCNKSDDEKLVADKDLFVHALFKEPMSGSPLRVGMLTGLASGCIIAVVCVFFLLVLLLIMI